MGIEFPYWLWVRCIMSGRTFGDTTTVVADLAALADGLEDPQYSVERAHYWSTIVRGTAEIFVRLSSDENPSTPPVPDDAAADEESGPAVGRSEAVELLEACSRAARGQLNRTDAYRAPCAALVGGSCGTALMRRGSEAVPTCATQFCAGPMERQPALCTNLEFLVEHPDRGGPTRFEFAWSILAAQDPQFAAPRWSWLALDRVGQDLDAAPPEDAQRMMAGMISDLCEELRRESSTSEHAFVAAIALAHLIR